MKQPISILISVGCTFFAFAENLLKNPEFENTDEKGETVEWRAPKPVFRFVSAEGRNGSRCLAYDNDNPSRYLLTTQRINVHTGYCYHLSAWVKTEKLTGSNEGARICMEWADARGKWIGGAYAGLSISDTKGKWHLLEAFTPAIPASAVQVTFSLLADHASVGKAWFDDVSVVRYFPPAVSAVVLSGYRGVTDGGILRIHAGLRLADCGIRTDEVDARFTISAKNGKIIERARPDRLTEESAFWQKETKALSNGEYLITVNLREKATGKSLGERSARFFRVDSIPERRVTIDRHNRLLVKGEPFFPLGMYWHSINSADMEIYAKGPFNCLMPYAVSNSNQLDLCESKNIKVIYSVKDIYAGSSWQRVQKVEEEEPMIRRIVAAYKDHPALIAWYQNDELSLVRFRTQLEAHQRLMEDIDPDHPTWIVLFQDPDGYQQTFDVMGIDHYPIPTDSCGSVLKKTRLTVRRTFGERPIWMVPQAMDWAVYKKGEDAKKQRFPTLLEMRSMAWQCIAGGANGLIFYSFFDLKKKTSHEPFETTWPKTCAVGEEIRRYFPALLSVEPVPPVTHDGPESLAVRVWKYKGELYVLVVNSEDKPMQATLTFDADIDRAKADFGPQPQRRGTRQLFCDLPALVPAMLRVSVR